MSVTMSVFIHSAKMPSPVAWAQAITSNGFDMQLPTQFNVRTQSGFLPCTYGGKGAGFEYFWETAAESDLDETAAEHLGDRDVVISFNTHSDMRGLMTSIVASALLCHLTGGVLWDTEAGEFIPAARVLGWAKMMEGVVKKEL